MAAGYSTYPFQISADSGDGQLNEAEVPDPLRPRRWLRGNLWQCRKRSASILSTCRGPYELLNLSFAAANGLPEEIRHGYGRLSGVVYGNLEPAVGLEPTAC